MEKREYVKKLKEYTQARGLSIYDYYYACARIYRSNEKFVLPEFEYNNPFLTQHDIQLLLNSSDSSIEEYFASAMTKVISLQSNIISKKEIKEVIDEKLDEVIKQTSNKDEAANNNEIVEETSNDDLEIHDEAADDTSKEETSHDGTVEQTSKDEKPAVKNEGTKKASNETQIKVLGETHLTVQKDNLSRKDIIDAINQEINQYVSNEESEEKNQQVSRKEIKEVVNEKLGLLSTFKVKIHSISSKIADLLNGFAVVKEEKTGRAHLYHYDAKKDSLTGEKVYYNDQLKVGSGYYVNYQEYLDNMIDDLVENNPTILNFHFVRDDGEVKTYNEVVEEAYAILVQNGALKFGKALRGKTFKTYKDFTALKLDEVEEYNGEPHKVGVYVRRDILERIFSKYKIKGTVKEEVEEKKVIK